MLSIVIVGNETTTNLIGNGVLALLRNPEQLQLLREDPSRIPAAVDELLRFDSPVQLDFRGVREDCEVNGTSLRRGDGAVLAIGGANREPEIFDEPERLDVQRSSGSSISFGRGVHYCLGAPLRVWKGASRWNWRWSAFPPCGCSMTAPHFAGPLSCAAPSRYRWRLSPCNASKPPSISSIRSTSGQTSPNGSSRVRHVRTERNSLGSFFRRRYLRAVRSLIPAVAAAVISGVPSFNIDISSLSCRSVAIAPPPLCEGNPTHVTGRSSVGSELSGSNTSYVQGDGGAFASITLSGFSTGKNVVEIVVTAEDETTQSYTLVVTRNRE